MENFNVHLATGDTATPYARTGYLGFIKRTQLTQTDGGKQNFGNVLNTHILRTFLKQVIGDLRELMNV